VGDDLIKKWGVNAVQGRFHREGTFYEHLTRFPAALIDPRGYIVFETEEDLRKSPRIKLGKKLNVRGGISTIPGYEKVPNPLIAD
jgi:hypothetical protein